MRFPTFPTRPASAIVAVAAAVALFGGGWALTDVALGWVAPPGEGTMIVFTSPMEPLLEQIKAGVALALPAVLGWGIAALYGWRRGERTGIGALASAIGALLGACLVGLAARVLWIRAAWAATAEMMRETGLDTGGSALVPTITVADLGPWRWAIAATIVAAVALAAVAVLVTRAKPRAPAAG